MHRSDEELFERFRRGDAAALGELFDRVAPALLRIAVHLAQDPAEAEDLLQATFLKAIEARAEWDGARPIVPWLCGVLQNRARTVRRRDARALPERAAGGAAMDPARCAEAAEFTAAVDAAIGELPERYQAVLRLHLKYGHAPAEIAHALGRAPATVRSQLARGLAKLRGSLPVGLLASSVALAAGAGVAVVRRIVMEQAGTVATAAVPAGSAAVGVVVVKKLLVACAALAAVVVVWLSATDASHREFARETTPEPLHERREPVHEQDVDARVARRERAAEREVAPSATGMTGSLRVRCRWAEDGLPAQNVLLEITPLGGGEATLTAKWSATGSDGTVLLEAMRPHEYAIASDRGGSIRAHVRTSALADVELVIPHGVDVRGRVVDERGAPVPRARIWLSRAARCYWEGREVAESDLSGCFTLRAVEPGRFLSARAPSFLAAVTRPIEGGAGEIFEVELALRERGSTLHGLVLDPAGMPVANASVLIGAHEGEIVWNPRLHAEHRAPLDLRTNARGEFTAPGLQPGKPCLVWARAAGFSTWYRTWALPEIGDAELVLHLSRGAIVQGVVTDRNGAPIAGASVEARARHWHTASGDFDGAGPPVWAHSACTSAADGSYRLERVACGISRVRAATDQHELRNELELAEGQIVTWNPVLADRTISGRVVDARGRPIAGARMRAWPPRGRGQALSATTDADGRFRWDRCVEVPYRIDCLSLGPAAVRPLATCREVMPGGAELWVQIPDQELPSARFEGRILDADGQPPRDGIVRCVAPGPQHPLELPVEPATGRFSIGPLPPGEYRLQATADRRQRRSRWSDPIRLEANESRDVGSLTIPLSGTVRVEVTDASGNAITGASVQISENHGWGEIYWFGGKTQQGWLELKHLAPGAHRLWIQGPGVGEFPADVVVAAGQVTRLELRAKAGIACKLVVSAATEPVPMLHIWSWVLDGRPGRCWPNWCEFQVEGIWPMALLPGSYELTITSETGKQEINRFTVGTQDPPDRRIPIRLP